MTKSGENPTIRIIYANVECSQVEKCQIPIANNPEQDYVPSFLSRELASIGLPKTDSVWRIQECDLIIST